MPESPQTDPRRLLLGAVVEGWIADPDSAVEYTEVVDGRRAVRMRQETRDYTTVWFDIGERSLRVEAYVLPTEPDRSEVFRQALIRNAATWRVHFALDREGGLVLRGRIGLDRLDEAELEYLLAEIYDLVETAFRPLLRARLGR